LSFDGSSHYSAVTIPSTLLTAGDFTLGIWIREIGSIKSSNYGSIIGRTQEPDYGDSYPYFGMGADGSGLLFIVGCSNPTVAPSVWHPIGTAALADGDYLVLKVVSGSGSFYRNGLPVASGYGGYWTGGPTCDTYFGKHGASTHGYPWTGSMQAAHIYSRGLTDAEVAANFTAGPASF
jgi:hypothetical protein